VKLDIIALRNVLKHARNEGWIKALPMQGMDMKPFRTPQVKRPLFTVADLEKLCAAAMDTKPGPNVEEGDEPRRVPITKNARQFCDYIRLLALCGGREQETIKLRWIDVHFDTGHVCKHCKHSITGTMATRSPCPQCGANEWRTTGRITIGADADISIYDIDPRKTDPATDDEIIRKAFLKTAYTVKNGEVVPMDVRNRVVVVTGASSGIGLATAKLLSKQGAKVVLVARSVEKLEELSREIPDSFAAPADLTKADEIKRMVKRAQDHYGRLTL
jgi:hypothetical protein